MFVVLVVGGCFFWMGMRLLGGEREAVVVVVVVGRIFGFYI